MCDRRSHLVPCPIKRKSPRLGENKSTDPDDVDCALIPPYLALLTLGCFQIPAIPSQIYVQASHNSQDDCMEGLQSGAKFSMFCKS